jgi:magnesium chelatase family protein
VEDFDKNKIKKTTSKELKEQVEKARNIQLKRFENSNKTYNSEMTNKDIEKFCIL